MEQPDYMDKKIWATNESKEPILLPEGIKDIQKVVGKLPFYEQSVDTTMMVALGTIMYTQ